MENRDALVSFKISICGIEELHGYTEQGVSHILSILDPAFPEPSVFQSLSSPRRLTLRFNDVIEEQEGMLPPQAEHVEALLRFGREMGAETPSDIHLLVHCHAGISRSTASMILLVAQAHPELAAASVVDEIVRVRPQAWPNLRILEIGDALLGRSGALVEAVRPQYRAVTLRDPEFARMIIDAGRRREVPPEML